ncbi:MAG: peptidoglycan-binding protein [Solirubrobacterales bacterium]|nr:peptidoglycan-binding protein [Solirubrobacterales bacterium]
MDRILRREKLSFGVIGAAVAAVAICVWISFGGTQSASAEIVAGGLNQTQASNTDGYAARFGTRTLREGMTGPDVRVLKGIVRSKSLLVGSPVSRDFDRPTTSAVKRFQKKRSLKANGVVSRDTAKTLVRSLRRSGASWYGPGFYGNRTACGQTLRPGTVGVAHKKLPCGSKVLIGYRGRYLMTTVIDRGPYVGGRSWDLTNGARKALKFDGVGDVRNAVVKKR